MITKYRKKPVVIEAIVLNIDNAREIEEWSNGKVALHYSIDIDQTTSLEYATISTLEGEMRADIGDYIIKGVKGEFYPCKPDIFEQTYEEV